MKDIQDALSQIQGNQGGGPRGRERGNGNGRSRGMEEHVMVIIKVIAKVEVVSEAE